MTRYRLSFGSLPKGAAAVRLDYRQRGSTVWNGLQDAQAAVATVEVPDGAEIAIRARVVEVNGAVSIASREITVRPPTETVVDRTAIASLTFPEPEIRQEGPTLVVTPKLPAGEDPDEYEFEVRQADGSDSEDDALHVGFVDADQEIVAQAWGDSQTIHTRPIRKADNATGPWSSKAVKTVDPVDAVTLDHSSDFTTGTIEDNIDTGVATMEAVGGGGIRFRNDLDLDELGTANTTLDDLADVPLDHLGEIPLEGVYTTAVVDTGAEQSLQFLWKPDLGTVTRPTPSLDDLEGDAIEWPVLDASGDYQDRRLRDAALTLDADNAPIVIRAKIATDAGGSPTFTDSDYEWWQPGRTYYCRSYSMRFYFYAYGLTRFVFDNLYVWRWCAEEFLISCHRKPTTFIEAETAHGFTVGEVLFFNTSSTWVKAKADAATTQPALGIVTVAATDSFRIATHGRVEIPSHGLTPGALYYLSPGTAGALTTTKPTSSGQYVQPFCKVLDTNTVLLLNHDSEVIP